MYFTTIYYLIKVYFCFYFRSDNYIWSTNLEFEEADKRVRMIQPSSEYGVVLMAWTLLHLKGKFGTKNVQKLEIYTEAMSTLKLWPSLLAMCQSTVVKVNIYFFFCLLIFEGDTFYKFLLLI